MTIRPSSVQIAFWALFQRTSVLYFDFLSSFAEDHIIRLYKMRGIGTPYFSYEASDDKTIFS
jgi:hypothetical protein